MNRWKRIIHKLQQIKKDVEKKEAEQGALLSLREYFQREREEAAVADAHALMSERIEELFALEKVLEHKDKGRSDL